jgi:hypothetical protein
MERAETRCTHGDADLVGRKGPIAGGLAGSAVALVSIACGAGFDGRMAAAGDAADLPALRFGYLVLGGCLLGGAQVRGTNGRWKVMPLPLSTLIYATRGQLMPYQACSFVWTGARAGRASFVRASGGHTAANDDDSRPAWSALRTNSVRVAQWEADGL